MEYAKIEIGTRGSIFKLDCNVFVHLCEDTWVQHIWKLIFDAKIEIDDDLEDFGWTRAGDSILASNLSAIILL